MYDDVPNTYIIPYVIIYIFYISNRIASSSDGR